jgi:hypothetical protein
MLLRLDHDLFVETMRPVMVCNGGICDKQFAVSLFQKIDHDHDFLRMKKTYSGVHLMIFHTQFDEKLEER